MKTLLAVLLLGGLAFAQTSATSADDHPDSVAAAAKKSREAKPATAKKVYTDDDMPSTTGGVSVVGNEAAQPSTTGYNPYSDPVRDQKALDAQWQQRISAQKARIVALQQQLQVAEANEARATRYYTVNSNPNFGKYKEQAESLRQQVENAKKELSDLQDEAHKAGANKAYD